MSGGDSRATAASREMPSGAHAAQRSSWHCSQPYAHAPARRGLWHAPSHLLGESGSPSPYLKQASSSKHTKVPIQAHPSSCLLACSLSPLEPGREAYEISVRNGRKWITGFGGNPGENAANRSSEGPDGVFLTTRVLSLLQPDRLCVHRLTHLGARTVPSRWLRAADLSIDEKSALARIGDGGQRRQ